MAEYIDSSEQSKRQYTYHWLESNLRENIKAFRTQCGYFRYNAIEPFAHILIGLASAGKIVRFVLGANDGDLYAEDLKDTLKIVQNRNNCKLTVVRFSGAKFHPKSYHITREDDSETAIVGSANLTGNGISLNVEASIVLDSAKDDPIELLREISNAIDSWGNKNESQSAFQVASPNDVDILTDKKIIDIFSPKVILRKISSEANNKAQRQLKGRNILWKKLRRRSKRITKMDRMTASVKTEANITSVELKNVIKRWCKKLLSSDAQQVREGTNPTGKLRLAKAGHDIDFKTWFRNDLFGDAEWVEERRSGKVYEVTEVPFQVKILDQELGEEVLKIDYALHRIADQNNIPTVLAWGHRLMRRLTSRSLVGDFVVIEKYDNGLYSLEITNEPPYPQLIN